MDSYTWANHYVTKLTEENKKLRELLWFRHGCTILYRDDGEMQCSNCQIDFLRDSPEIIVKRWLNIAKNELQKRQSV